MAGRRPWDIGYSTIVVAVGDFDATLRRASALGSPPLTAPLGPDGARRVCVRDPEGVLVELAEDDFLDDGRVAHEHAASAVRALRLSTPDLERSLAFFEQTLGLRRTSDDLVHCAEHERLWGLEGPAVRTAVLDAGGIALELAEYSDPVPNPWPPGYRISDQGLLNVAFTFDGLEGFRDAVRRLSDAGYRFNCRPIAIPGVVGLTYLNDDQGFSVELLHLPPWIAWHYGFTPRRVPRGGARSSEGATA